MGTDSEMNVINEVYRGIPSILIDYGIVEKRDIVKAISADMGRRLLQSEFRIWLLLRRKMLILVCDKELVQDAKLIVDYLKKEGCDELL